MQDHSPPKTPAKLPLLLAQLAALAVAAVPRLFPWPRLFAGDLLLPFSNDASYHARRILRLVEHFRYPGLFDPLFDWPRGAPTHWSPGFDCIAAALALLLGGAHDPRRTAQVMALLPVVYGLAGVAAVGTLATRVAARANAEKSLTAADDASSPPRAHLWATAALFVALVPQSVVISQAGFVDHHVTEILFTALLWRWTVAGTELAEQRADLRRRARFEAVGAILVTAAVWVQSVGLLYVGVAAAALAILPLVRRASGESRPGEGAPSSGDAGERLPAIGGGGPALAGAAVLLALLYAPAVREHGHRYAYEFPSYFQPVLLALGASGVVTAGLVAARLRGNVERDARPAGVALRAAAAILGAGAAALAVFALVPAARSAFLDLLRLAATKGPDLSRIDELQPLLGAPRAPDGSRLDRLDAYFGWTGLACAVLLPVGLHAVRRAGRERVAGICVWTFALLALSLSQNRWSRVLVVPIAVLSAHALHFLGGRAQRILGRGEGATSAPPPAPAARYTAPLALAAALVLLLAPDPVRALTREPVQDTAVMEAGIYLRSLHRPAEPGRRSGLLAPWGDGFQLLYVSGLPILSTGHAWLVGEDGYRLERAAWGGTPEALWSLMDTRDLGFVVAGADNLAHVTLPDGAEVSLLAKPGATPGAEALDWSYFKVVPLGVLALGGTALPDLGVRHLEHLCPRSAGSEFAPLQVPLPRLWVFERVEGALLEGQAEPGSRVVAELHLQHAAGVVSYFAFTDAGEGGAFSIRFPVPTRMAERTLRSAKTVRVQRKGVAVTEVEVPEAAVRAGAHVAVPAGAVVPK